MIIKMNDIHYSTISGSGKVVQILCVDDSREILDILSTIFSVAYKKVKVYKAESNQEAFKLASKYCPDLILTDIIRPGGDGYEFLNMLRNDIRTRYIPVFSVSGSVSAEVGKLIKQADSEELKQYRAGFNRVIPKPIKIDQLLNAAEWFFKGGVNPDHALLYLGTETPTLDYKESLNLNTRDDRAKVAKDVIAMANSGGGTIIVGVAEKTKGHFEHVGLNSTVLENLEVSLVNRSLRAFIDPVFHIGVRKVSDGGKTYVFIEIPGSKGLPILAKKSNESAALYQGRIYIRTSAAESREITDSTELRQLFDRFPAKS
jgi:CheY-like chemotaxis protein